MSEEKYDTYWNLMDPFFPIKHSLGTIIFLHTYRLHTYKNVDSVNFCQFNCCFGEGIYFLSFLLCYFPSYNSDIYNYIFRQYLLIVYYWPMTKLIILLYSLCLYCLSYIFWIVILYFLIFIYVLLNIYISITWFINFNLYPLNSNYYKWGN